MTSMRKWKQILVALAAVAIVVVSDTAEDVAVLTQENFEIEVGQEKGALVEFYAPWCGHCKRLEPEYKRLGLSFKRTKSVLIGKVNCDEHKRLCTRYGVSGYPSIMWFPSRSLQPKKYAGSRTADDMANFVNKEGGTYVEVAAIQSDVVALTAESFDQVVMDDNKDVLVEFYVPWCGICKSIARTYEKVGAAFKMDGDVVIANLDSDKYKDKADIYGVSNYPTLKFFPRNNKAGENYTGGLELEDFLAFVNRRCGTGRDESGRLTSEAGVVENLEVLVKEFLSANSEEKLAVISRFEEETEKLIGRAARYGKIYLKTARKSMEKSADYAKNEIERLDRLLEQPIEESKAEELIVRKNILSSFA